MKVRAVFLMAVAIALPCAGQSVSDVDVEAYGECVKASTDPNGSIEKAIEACLAPANAGIPGAQYAEGATLVARNQAGDRTAGIDFLEKAAASRNPAAAYALSGILLQEESPTSQSRGRDYLKAAVCAGYPLALTALQKGGVKREDVSCPPVAEEDFTGEWIADLKWVKAGATPPKTPDYSMKIVIADDMPHVFQKVDTAWTEVKAGRFKLEKHGQSATVTTTDVGWDFDGQWIESWTIQLMRTGVDEAQVAYMRVVNNPYMPHSFTWRAFSSYSEGSARRTKAQ